MDQIRFGIVGAGLMGFMHAEAIHGNQAAALVAVCDRQRPQAERLAGQYPGCAAFSDLEEMLTKTDLDAVSVCTPSGLHAEATVLAAERGKHVLCEKPLEISRSRMDIMISTCRRNHVKLGGVLQRRTMEAAVLTRSVLERGGLGRLVLADAYLKYYRKPEYYRESGWRGTWELDGGGALINQGIHGVDLIQWLMGGAESVYAYAGALLRDIPVEDTAVAVVRYANGAFGVIEAATSVYPGLPSRFEVHGEQGTIGFSDAGIDVWEFPGAQEEQKAVRGDVGGTRDPGAISSEGHRHTVEDFVQAILQNREPMVNGEEARRGVELVLAMYESARRGCEVRLDAMSVRED